MRISHIRVPFLFNFSFLQGCGGRTYLDGSGDTKEIQSLDTDGNGRYENDLDCQWLVVGTEGLVMALTFTRFDVEDKTNATRDDPCWDYVEVR